MVVSGVLIRLWLMSANARLTRQRMRGVVARFDQQNCLTIARSLTFTYLLTPCLR